MHTLGHIAYPNLRYKSMISNAKLDFWISHKLNVLLIGTHGIGKTAIIEDAFNRHNLKWRYFSAATMDPWVDFIGVPKEVKRENGQSCLELIRPAEFQDDAVEAIFFDEFNRAPAKVRNAVMELIQFKSINGRKFHNLKVIWAAINPYDEEETYDVEQLDPAQQDRFQIIYELPATPSKDYFVKKFGETLGTRAIDWWENLPPNAQKLVSPRRLDYALDHFKAGGDLKDVLVTEVRPRSLKQGLERVGDPASDSHKEQWTVNGEGYARKMKSAASKIDVIEAFKVLKTISVDQAVAYLLHLSSSQLKKIASDVETVDLLIRPLMNQQQPTVSLPKITAALIAQDVDKSSKNKMFTECFETTRTSNATVFAAIRSVNADRNSTASWSALSHVIDKEIKNKTLQYEDCYITMTAILDRLRTTRYPNRSSLGTTITQTMVQLIQHVSVTHSTKFVEFLSIDAKSMIKILREFAQ